MHIDKLAATALLLLTLACGGKPDDHGNRTRLDTSMGGMGMTMAGMQMIPTIRLHLDSLSGLSPSEMTAAMAAHQDLAARMMDAMGADMRGMNMPADPAWVALGDSLRRDLAELSGLPGDALKSGMEAHIGRMRRMLAMHEGMMKM